MTLPACGADITTTTDPDTSSDIRPTEFSAHTVIMFGLPAIWEKYVKNPTSKVSKNNI